MKRGGFLAVLLVWGTVGAVLLLSQHETASAQSPDSWRQLSLADFVREITQLTSGSEPLADELWAEIRSQAAERLLQAVAAGTPADYGDLVSLYLWGRPQLSPEQTTTALAGLVPQATQVSAWTIEKLLAVHARMNEAGLPVDALHTLVLAWLEQRDVRTLANVDQLGWLFAQVQLAHRQDTGRQAFTVRWTGTLQPPVDGACTLSICPLRLNFRSGQTFREESTKIFVAEQPVLDSARDGGTFRADPVTLTAGQRVPLRVELSFACSSAGVIGDLPAVALLYWEAPGLARQLVPSAALATPDGRQPGLQGDYALQVGENQVTTTRVDPQLNFVWYHQCFVVSPLAELRNWRSSCTPWPVTRARWPAGRASRGRTPRAGKRTGRCSNRSPSRGTKAGRKCC